MVKPKKNRQNKLDRAERMRSRVDLQYNAEKYLDQNLQIEWDETCIQNPFAIVPTTLSQNGELSDITLRLAIKFQGRSLEDWHIGLCFGSNYIDRVDYERNAIHINNFHKFRPRDVPLGEIKGPHHHKWIHNKGAIKGDLIPDKLPYAVDLDSGWAKIKTFTDFVRHYAKLTKIIIPKSIDLEYNRAGDLFQ